MLTKSHIHLVFMTCPDRESSVTLARSALDRKLVACVNLIPSIGSMYIWDNELVEEEEFLLLAKTTEENLISLESLWVSNHPYEVPEIVVVEADRANENYERWLHKCCSGLIS